LFAVINLAKEKPRNPVERNKHNLRSKTMDVMFIKILPKTIIMWPELTMNISSSLPAKKASHFPVNESHYFVIMDYQVRLSKVVMHEAHVWIGIGVREEDIAF
jgi:hypothetical protein